MIAVAEMEHGSPAASSARPARIGAGSRVVYNVTVNREQVVRVACTPPVIIGPRTNPGGDHSAVVAAPVVAPPAGETTR